MSVHRNAPLTNPDGDIDGALEQMSSFADEAVKTSADEELYSGSLTGQAGAHFLPKGQDKPTTPPKVILHQVHASGRADPLSFISTGMPLCSRVHAARSYFCSIHS